MGRVVYADFHVTGSLRESGSTDRFLSYGGGGTPTTWVDGRTKLSGGNDAASRYEAAFVAAAADSAVLSVELEALYDPVLRRAMIECHVEVAEDIENFEECVVQIVVIEDGVVSRDRVFDRTVRHVFAAKPLLRGVSGDRIALVESLELPEGWDPERVSAIGWVHRGLPNERSSREVLNAGQSPNLGSTPVLEKSWGGVKALWR